MHGAPRGLSPYSARLQTTCPHGVISTASTGTGTAAEAAAARAIGRGDGPPSSARFMTLPGVASGSPGVERSALSSAAANAFRRAASSRLSWLETMNAMPSMRFAPATVTSSRRSPRLIAHAHRDLARGSVSGDARPVGCTGLLGTRGANLERQTARLQILGLDTERANRVNANLVFFLAILGHRERSNEQALTIRITPQEQQQNERHIQASYRNHC